MKGMAISALAVLFAAMPLAAQQRDSVRAMGHVHGAGMGQGQGHGRQTMGGGMMMMEEMMGPMHRGMAFAPARLLEHQEQLVLTPQQVTRLTQLRDAAKSAHDAAHHEAMQHMQELAKVQAAAAPDTAALRAHFMGHHDAMGRAHWTMLRASSQAKAVLTDGQRGRVEGWADAMQMHREHGAMPRRP